MPTGASTLPRLLPAGIARPLRCWPFLVLATALATLFPFFHESGPLHRPEQIYDHISFHHLALARNLSADHGWLGFYSRTANGDGEPAYRVYNR